MIFQTDRSRTYYRAESAVFLKTHEQFGGLSNMAGGYPLLVNGIRILSSEALYQACRFPDRPDVQRLIIGQKSPMSAKMVSKPHRKDSRADWEDIKVSIMRWCLRVKLAQNWERFRTLLLSTDDLPIVEESRRDPYWGARAVDAETLKGMNVLGRLLMELREMVKSTGQDSLGRVLPPSVPQFLLLDKPIGVVEWSEVGELMADLSQAKVTAAGRPSVAYSHVENMSLFPVQDESTSSGGISVDADAQYMEAEAGQSNRTSPSPAGGKKRRGTVAASENATITTARQKEMSRPDSGPRTPYWGTFENSAGARMRFVYDYSAGKGILYLEESASKNLFLVHNGQADDLPLTEPESLWLRACWQAAREREILATP